MPKMVFIERDGTRKEVDAPLGLSVLEIAHRHGIDIEGACEGSLACSTCHVIVDGTWFAKLAGPTEDEEDMLDLAFDLQETSRLGCQIVMTEKLDGLVVKLPKAAAMRGAEAMAVAPLGKRLRCPGRAVSAGFAMRRGRIGPAIPGTASCGSFRPARCRWPRSAPI